MDAGRPTPRWRSTPRSPTSSRDRRPATVRRRRAAAGQGARRGASRSLGELHRAATWSAGPTSARSSCRFPLDGRALRRARRLRDHRGRHRPGPPGAGVRRRRPRGRPRATGCRWSTRSRPTGTSTPTLPLVGGMFFKDADEPLVADLRRRGLLFRHVAVRAHLPALLALRHRRCSTTRCRPGTSGPPRSRTRCSRENEATNWYPGHDQARPLRRLAEQQHRLGAVAQPVLGHAAADLALRRRPAT